MSTIASQITSLTIVYSTVYSDANQRKHQSSASLAFVRGIYRGPVNSPHKWPVTRKMFPFDGVIMWTVVWIRKIFMDSNIWDLRNSCLNCIWNIFNQESIFSWKGGCATNVKKSCCLSFWEITNVEYIGHELSKFGGLHWTDIWYWFKHCVPGCSLKSKLNFTIKRLVSDRPSESATWLSI